MKQKKTYEDGLRDGLAACMQYARAEYTYYSEATGGDCDIDWDDAKRAIEALAKREEKTT